MNPILSSKNIWMAAQNPIHILVNNSGGPPLSKILDAETEQFKKAFAHIFWPIIRLRSILVQV
jgi:hypothetical protein